MGLLLEGRTVRRLLACAALVAATGAAHSDQGDPLGARSIGSAAAPVTVYEMSDFQCPYCRRHAIETMPDIEREYVATGKVRWVFINFPIPEIHPNAVPAAEFAVCAARSGKFWKAHHLLFRNQATWARLPDPAPFLLSLADSAGINRGALVACLQDPRVRGAVEAEARGAIRSGATSTPTFYIEGGLLEGAQPIEVFRPILDSIHRARTTSR
jgi:protein-disulfide isomerase